MQSPKIIECKSCGKEIYVRKYSKSTECDKCDKPSP